MFEAVFFKFFGVNWLDWGIDKNNRKGIFAYLGFSGSPGLSHASEAGEVQDVKSYGIADMARSATEGGGSRPPG
jgi:hypothetical protein